MGYWTEAQAPCWPSAKPQFLATRASPYGSCLDGVEQGEDKERQLAREMSTLRKVNMEVIPPQATRSRSQALTRSEKILQGCESDRWICGGPQTLPYHTPSLVLPPNYPLCLPHLPMDTATSPRPWAATGLLGSFLHSICGTHTMVLFHALRSQ